MNQRVLLADGERSLREVVTRGLEVAGFGVAAESDGEHALVSARHNSFAVMLFDLTLPTLGGFDLCREVRRDSRTPIILLGAATDPAAVVAALECGADDYVKKPFHMSELLARVRAVLRRAVNDADDGAAICINGLEIDPVSCRVRKRGREISLSALEFRLLLELARRPGRVFTREVLLEGVWNYDHLGDSRMVDMAIKRLREKVEDQPRSPQLISTVRGIGYRLERN